MGGVGAYPEWPREGTAAWPQEGSTSKPMDIISLRCCTVLHLAAFYGYADVIDVLLLMSPADVCSRNSQVSASLLHILPGKRALWGTGCVDQDVNGSESGLLDQIEFIRSVEALSE